jgi:ABC-type cobalamin/Fe3+-siderophores transport system ATPase subunit
MSALRARSLKKSYRSRQVLQDVSVEVDTGEVVGLLGPNGAGKTTCFYLIVGLIPADQGRIELKGRDITLLPMHARARAGLSYLPRSPRCSASCRRGTICSPSWRPAATSAGPSSGSVASACSKSWVSPMSATPWP